MNPPASSRVSGVVLASPEGGEITIHAFPNDARFIRDIRRAALAVGPGAASEADLQDLLATALRAWYPRVEIREREALAGLNARDRVWYVLRDGRAGKSSALVDRLHSAMSDARQTSAESDAVVERSRAALAFANQPRPHRRRTPTTGPEVTDEHVATPADR